MIEAPGEVEFLTLPKTSIAPENACFGEQSMQSKLQGLPSRKLT